MTVQNKAVPATIHQFQPGEIWPDTDGAHINAHGGGFLLHEGVYYWFGEHKVAGTEGNRAQVGVGVYSSTDLYHWRNERIALAVSDDPASDIVRNCIIERPKVIYNARTKQFVMWFHLELLGQGYKAARVGVAVADRVTGPYRYVRSFRPNAGHWPMNASDDRKLPLTPTESAIFERAAAEDNLDVDATLDLINRRDHATGQMSRDMALFVDDDGAAYHIAASEENATLMISRLTDDYLDTTGQYTRAMPGRFHEAPAIFKRRGQYYMFSSGCTGWTPNAARLSVAPALFGPWTELGNPCVGDESAVARTFESQSTYVLPVAGRHDAFIFVADRWRPQNAIDGRYVWLPIEFDASDKPFIRWRDAWSLDEWPLA